MTAASDVAGVPFLPPGRVTAGTNRIRDGIGRLRQAMAPPPVRILESLFGLLEHRVLVALCEAGVPDVLQAPMRIADLAAATGSDPERLERLVRFGASRQWLRIDRRGRVRPTRVTAFLRDDHPGGWRAWVDFAGGEEVVRAVAALSAMSSDADPFTDANGAPFFDWMARHPDRWATFDRAMAAGGRMHALALAAGLDWEGTGRICDVGGGTGDLLGTLLDQVPGASGTVFDLPAVVARAGGHERLSTLGGDAFTTIPDGFDTYLLVNVLHDWNDADAGRILANVARAMPRHARVIIVEGAPAPVPRNDLPASTDVLMAALTNGGRERDTAAFAQLGLRVGLRLRQTTLLASGDFAHQLEPAVAAPRDTVS